MIPSPVTSYSPEKHHRIINTDLYKVRVLQDVNMQDVEALINYGNTVFDKLTDLVDLTDFSSIQAETKASFLPNNFEPINDTATEFYLKFKPHNGMLSLRRGFYKLLPIPNQTFNLGIENWQTDVLYNEGLNDPTIYKYKCNIGTLVNSLSVIGDFTTNKFRNYWHRDKKEVLLNIVNKTIYVSSAELVVNNDFNSLTKEVLWFGW